MAEPRYNPLMVPGCIPAPLRRALDDASGNFTEIAGDIENVEGDLGDIVDILLTNPTNLADYFTHVDGDFSNYVAMHRPEIPIELTSGFTDSGGGIYTATCKLLLWGGSSYAVTGSNATITDIYNEWRHAYSGDRGFLTKETLSTRNVLCASKLNTKTRRDVTISGTLARDASTTWTDADDSKTGTVYGRYIPTGLTIPSGCRIGISWFPRANTGDGRWYADVIDKCVA